jgi:Tup N-terminal
MSYVGAGHRAIPIGPAGRLEELLDQIRLAFESVSQDVEHSKSQHSDYERRSSHLSRIIANLLSVSSSSRNQYSSSTLFRPREST